LRGRDDSNDSSAFIREKRDSGATDAILYRYEELYSTKSLLTLETIMDLTLMSLKRYAIDNRVEIRFTEPGSDCVCLISDKGLVKIPSHAENIKIEDVLAAAQSFDVIAQDRPQKLTRAQMVETVNEAFKKRSFAPATSKDDD
jgi:hypothetical protein